MSKPIPVRVFTPAQEARIKELIREALASPSGRISLRGASVEVQRLSASLTDEGLFDSERAARLMEAPVVVDDR